MKALFKIVFFLLCVQLVNAQEPAGSPTINSPGWAKYKWLQGRLILDNVDTGIFVPRFGGTMIYQPQDGGVYYYDSITKFWQRLVTSSDVPLTIYTGNGSIPGVRNINFQNTGSMYWNNIPEWVFFGTKNAFTSTSAGMSMLFIDGSRKELLLGNGIPNGGVQLSVTRTNSLGPGTNPSLRMDTIGGHYMAGMLSGGYQESDSILTINGLDQVKKRSISSFGFGANNTNIGLGFRVLSNPSTQTLRTIYNSNTILWDSTSNTDGLTAKVDTSVIATQYDLTQVNTNLSNTRSATEVTINSSTGTGTSVPAATFTNAGVFTARDKQMLDSAFKAFKSSYSGDTSLVFWTGILRPSWGNISVGDTIRWNLLGISDDHDTLYVTTVRANPTGKISVKYPHMARVLLAIANADEMLSGKGAIMGFSSGLDSSVLTLSVPSTPNNLTTTTGNGTGWSSGLWVWAAGTTTLTPGGGFLAGFDAYSGNVEYIGTNNYRVKYVTSGVSNLTVRFQLWDNTTNTLVTTAPTSSDILLYRRPLIYTPINLYQFTSSGIQASVFGATAPNQTSGANIWVFGIGKRSTN